MELAASHLVRRRVAAYLIDITILFVTLAPTTWLFQRALGVAPSTGPHVWLAAFLSFSVPAWLYFTISDASKPGATVGKRLLKLRVSQQNGERVGRLRALFRTAVKLLPWELVHLFAFGLAPQAGDLTLAQNVGLATANMLALIYLGCAFATRGQRSVHDYFAGTVLNATG